MFALNGFAFASWVSRIPEARDRLDLTPGELGTILLALALGSVIALPSAGWWVHRFGATRVVACAAVVDAVGLAVAGLGAGAAAVWLTTMGLFLLGFGSGVWDVAMNIEGAAVERELGRTIMPRSHAAFSLGAVAGAAVGAAAAGFGLPITVHLPLAAAVVMLVPLSVVRAFLPAGTEVKAAEKPRNPMRAWTEPRTLTIGLMVLAMALTEGVANDWLAVALVDGYDVPAWVGASGFALFVTAMTVGRIGGAPVLDRFGRVPVIRGSMALAGVGLLLVVFGEVLLVVALGTVMWGFGAALGFPVGMSAAADEPDHAAARVSVVSTIGYTAFLAGPPALGYLGDHVGVLHALLLAAALLVPSVLAVPALRQPSQARLGLPKLLR